MSQLSISGIVQSDSNSDPIPGYRVAASVTREVKIDPERSDTIELPAHGSGVAGADGSFEFDVAGDGAPTGAVTVSVSAFDGTLVEVEQFTLEDIRSPLTLRVPPPQPLSISPAENPARGELVTLTGRVIDAKGREVAVGLPVVLWGKTSATASEQPLVVTKTQLGGFFSGAWVSTVVDSAFGKVAGSAAIPIGLHDQRLPRRVLLVLDAPEGDPEADEHPPRAPDPADLTRNPAAFSQDLGRGCIELCTPNRVIEEFTYSTVVRTSEPDVQGLTLGIRRFVPKGMLVDLVQAAAMQEVMFRGKVREEDVAALNDLKLDVDAARQLASGDNPPALADIKRAAWLSEVHHIKDLIGITLSGAAVRQPLDADHAIDWDETPTIYQAVSIARGHILEFREIWRADGYSLGDLLYSLPLAPGQRRQVAIVDWERRSRTQRDEVLEFEEQLEAFVARDRDVSEIVGSRLAEENAGASSNTTWGVAGGIGAGFIGSGFGIFGGVAGSSGGSQTTSWAEGSRRFTADTLQSLRDRVMQRSSSVRDQRSTVVQTAAQGETLRTETETVANYNHCHAMTVEYFEVLRHFIVTHELADVRECLFVPLPMGEFTRGKALRWQTPLVAHFTDRVLLPGFDAMRRIADNWEGWDYPLARYSEEAPQHLDGELRIAFVLPRPRDGADGTFQVDMWDPYRHYLWMDPYELWTKYLQTSLAAYNAVEIAKRDAEFREKIAPELARSIMDRLHFWYVTNNGSEVEVGLDATLVSRYAEGVPLYVTLRPRGALPPVPREDIVQFKISLEGAELPDNAQIVIHTGKVRYRTEHKQWLLFGDDNILNDLSNTDAAYIPTPVSWEERRNPRKEDRELEGRLLAHLNAGLEFYHQVVWMWLDAERRFMLLDGILVPGLGGKSVASVVENRVIGIAGNSLILPLAPGLRIDPRINSEGESDLIDFYAADAPPPMRLSVPTRGVYAEAIQGHCVACEEIDDSRYWRWTNEGMLALPEIETVDTGTRAVDETPLTPTALPGPLVSIQNAPSLPAITPLSEVFKVLAKPDLFTDIAGLEGTQKNARAAFDAALSAASGIAGTAADLAKQNFATKDGERMLDRISKALKDDLLTPAQAKELSSKVLGTMTGTPDEKAEKKAGAPAEAPTPQKAVKDAKDADKASVKIATLDETFEANFDNTTAIGAGSGVSISPFPSAYPDPLDQSASNKMQTSFDTALAAMTAAQRSKLSKVAVTFVAQSFGSGGTHPAGGQRQTEVHFTGSMIKIAAMYASFELRAAVRRLAEDLKLTDSTKLFDALKTFDDPIKKAVKAFQGDPSLTDEHLLPKYKTIFETVPEPGGAGWLTFKFKNTYEATLEGMIVGQHNTDARDSIHAVSFGYINGALAAGGFFDAATSKGLWLAGDYQGQWPAKRIPSENDGPSAQAATTAQAARMFSLMTDRKLVDQQSSDDMLKLTGHSLTWLTFTTPHALPASSTVEVLYAKVGRGPLNAGGEALSEVEIVHAKSADKWFVVVWQNLTGPMSTATLKPVAVLIEQTITEFLKP